MDSEFRDFVINKINTLNNLLTTPISFSEPLEDMEKDILLGNLTLVENAYHAQLITESIPEPPEPEDEEPEPIITPINQDFRGPNPIYLNPKTFIINIYGPVINQLNLKNSDYILLYTDDSDNGYIVKWQLGDSLQKDGRTPNAVRIHKIDNHHYQFKSKEFIDSLSLEDITAPIINAKHYGHKFELYYTSFNKRGCLKFSTSN